MKNRIYCINNVRVLDNGGQERLPLTLGKSYEYWEKQGKNYLLVNDDVEEESLQRGRALEDTVADWYDECYFVDLPFTVEDVISSIGLNKLKVKNIYIYGSQVYGSAHEGSDYDIAVTANQMMTHEEKRVNVNGAKLNIHVYTPDVFLAALNKHDIMNLECIFAPSWAILQEKDVLSRDTVVKRIIKNVLTQSQSSWFNGKMKIRDHNIDKGVKSIFHAMRMLMFAAQIAQFGKITDFTVGNNLYKEMMECDEFEWDYYKEKYLPIKIELEEKLKSYAKNEQ
jgi:hypothetical protein